MNINKIEQRVSGIPSGFKHGEGCKCRCSQYRPLLKNIGLLFSSIWQDEATEIVSVTDHVALRGVTDITIDSLEVANGKVAGQRLTKDETLSQDINTYTYEELLTMAHQPEGATFSSVVFPASVETHECNPQEDCQVCHGTGECQNCDEEGHVECPKCHGNGECYICHGTGECSKCHGSTHCDKCLGTGKCYSCQGDGTCHHCNGSGTCSVCDGEGEITCNQCNGEGGWDCNECNGFGSVLCPSHFCSGGICTDCNGTGTFELRNGKKVSCRKCNGTGKCQRCKGSGKVKCRECEGSGWIECSECHGSGQVRCKSCGGDGDCHHCEHTGTCKKCNGTGNCENCHGSGNCDSCNGTGKCSRCKGSGLCRHCQGAKVIDCPECGGTNKCKNCNGSGKVDCHVCHGTGYYQTYHTFGLSRQNDQESFFFCSEYGNDIGGEAIQLLWDNEVFVKNGVKQTDSTKASYAVSGDYNVQLGEVFSRCLIGHEKVFHYILSLKMEKVPITKITYKVQERFYNIFIIGKDNILAYDQIPSSWSFVRSWMSSKVKSIIGRLGRKK